MALCALWEAPFRQDLPYGIELDRSTVHPSATTTKTNHVMTYTKDLMFPTTNLRPFTDVWDRFFGEMDPFAGGSTTRRSLPRVNILEDEKTYKLEVQAPGYGKDELKLNLEQDVLTISADKEQESLKENERYTRCEFTRHSFSRSFRLPELVDTEQISAEHRNGVLMVSIPKKTEVKPTPKQITIG